MNHQHNSTTPYFIHPTALVDTTQIGEGTRIWQFTVIMKEVSIGKNCNIGAHCFIERSVHIGDRVTIKNGVQLWEGVTVEDDVFIGPNATFTNDLYPRSRNPQFQPVKTLIKRGASIGANATIVAGTTIGEYAMIGAAAVVTRDVPPHALMVGVPARQVGLVCSCGHILWKGKEPYQQAPQNGQLTCPKCHRAYALVRKQENAWSLKPVGSVR